MINVLKIKSKKIYRKGLGEHTYGESNKENDFDFIVLQNKSFKMC